MTLRILGGRFRHRHLISPKGLAVRPSTGRVREALFNICQLFIEGTDFLDLFAGSGAIGLEALSRGARQATFVENDRLAVGIIRDNVKSLLLESQSTVLQGDVFRFLERFAAEKRQFSLIFADPPYAQQGPAISQQLLQMVDTHQLLKTGGRLFIEEAVEAIPTVDTASFQHLALKDQRRYGRTVLQQWVMGQKVV